MLPLTAYSNLTFFLGTDFAKSFLSRNFTCMSQVYYTSILRKRTAITFY